MRSRHGFDLALAACVLAVATVVAGCATVDTSATQTPIPTPSPASTPRPSVDPVSFAPGAFDLAFSAMTRLKPIVSSGKGRIGVILPSATGRFATFDIPYFRSAFAAAGYANSDFSIDDARGNVARQIALAQAALAAGATVLIVDPLTPAAGTAIQKLTQQHGAALVAYDQPVFAGNATYFVGFDNGEIGRLIGTGFMQCVSDWGVQSPMVFQLGGGVNVDPNAIALAKGYNSVVWGQAQTQVSGRTTNSLGYTLVTDQPAPGWNVVIGTQIFAAEFKAHPQINATLEANDALANGVIGQLRLMGIPARKIPTTGQDATMGALLYILRDYQCGTVYKPIYPEVQAAVALASVVRGGGSVLGLINGTAAGPSGASQPAFFLSPVWVDKSNVASTVVKDGFISAAVLCRLAGAAVCSANGIAP